MRLSRAHALVGLVVLALVGAATAGMVAHAGAGTKTITVTEKEFRIHLSSTKTAPGTVHFVVENTGKFRHALAIAGPGVTSKRTALIRPGKVTVVFTWTMGASVMPQSARKASVR